MARNTGTTIGRTVRDTRSHLGGYLGRRSDSGDGACRLSHSAVCHWHREPVRALPLTSVLQRRTLRFGKRPGQRFNAGRPSRLARQWTSSIVGRFNSITSQIAPVSVVIADCTSRLRLRPRVPVTAVERTRVRRPQHRTKRSERLYSPRSSACNVVQEAALTIATIPTRTASGSRGHARITSVSSRLIDGPESSV